MNEPADVPHDPILLRRLWEHFGTDPARLPITSQSLDGYELPNLQLAIDEMLLEENWTLDLIGPVALHYHESPSLARLSRPGSSAHFDEGPVDYKDVELADGKSAACVSNGLYLLRSPDHPVALLVGQGHHPMRQTLSIEVMSPQRDAAQQFLRGLVRRTRYGHAFRGHVLSLESDCYGGTNVRFHRLPEISQDDIILPDSILERIERHTIGFSRNAEKLRRAGRHLKRGILLHGPPGTGKTLTAMYLACQMPGRTVLLATGGGMGSLEVACRLARALEPATVVLEDVDLIGTEREHQTVGANALLFELLNQMDGLADDVDLLFVLTTNRPDILEPALSSRPGRIDQAIEVPPPDADCRRRLFDLYSQGLDVRSADVESVVERTEGASAAFIRELLRKAAVLAADLAPDEDSEPLAIRDEFLAEAMTELFVAGGTLTQSLLGGSRPPESGAKGQDGEADQP